MGEVWKKRKSIISYVRSYFAAEKVLTRKGILGEDTKLTKMGDRLECLFNSTQKSQLLLAFLS